MEDKNSFGNHLSLESVKVIAESIGIGKMIKYPTGSGYFEWIDSR